MSEGINIEIIGNYKERYPAKIQSFSGENELFVKFDDNPDILCKVQIKSVLVYLESNNSSKNSDYQVGCEVLAFRKLDDSDINNVELKDAKLTHAWWPAKIDKLKGCFAVIQFTNASNENATDIVELSSLRPIHDGRQLSKNDIHIHEMLVPDDLCDFCEHYNIRGDLIRWCGPAIVVNFDKNDKKLQIFSTQKEVVHKASLLDAPFMKVLRQKKQIQMQKAELTKRLNDTIKNQYTEKFTVAEEFMGLAIGTQGSNIKKARDIEGVINIDLDDQTHTFTISAQTQEACKSARAQLEYMKKIFYVPMDIVSKVIGRNGNQIQDIIDQSGIMRVRVVDGPDLQNWHDDENIAMLSDHVPFIFVGSANSIRDAGLLLEFSIDHHRDMDRLQKERDEIQREIRNNQVSSNVPSKLGNHSANEREDDHHNNQPSRGYNSGGRNRGRNNYTHVTSSDVEQRNDSYNDDPAFVNQQKYRGNGRTGAPYRRGGGSFRQGSMPPTGNDKQNGYRRYQHQFDDDTDDYMSATNGSENGRGGSGGYTRYRGNNKPRGGRGRPQSGGDGGNHYNNVNNHTGINQTSNGDHKKRNDGDGELGVSGGGVDGSEVKSQ